MKEDSGRSEACSICGGAPPSRKHRKAGIDILKCPDCGLEYWLPDCAFVPERTYTSAYFADRTTSAGYDDYASLERSLRSNFARRVSSLGAPSPGARLLDLGAAYGFAVDEARRQGWDAFGLELCVDAARRAAGVCGGRAVAANLAFAPFADASFEVVTLWDVIEHLPNPRSAALEAARLLRPGGRLLLSTGDAGSWLARLSGPRWHLYTLPEHLFFFTRDSVRLLLEDAGFRVERIRAEGSRYTVGYLAERLRKTLLGREGDGGRWPGSGLSLPVNLFDIMTVSARRL